MLMSYFLITSAAGSENGLRSLEHSWRSFFLSIFNNTLLIYVNAAWKIKM